MNIEHELRDLTPPQEMINFMLKYSFFHKQVTQIPASVIVDKDIDFDIMKKALNIEIERNDCMRLRFVKKNGKVKQYFIDEYKIDDIPIVSFNTKEEQEAYLTADAQKVIHHMKGEIYRFIFFNSYDGRQGIYINVSHLVMDAAAVFVFYSDLFAVYDSLAEGKNMPKPLGKYSDVITKELNYINNKDKVNRDREFYTEYYLKDGEPIYNGVHGPALLQSLRKKKKNPKLRVTTCFDPIHDKAVLTKKPVSEEDSKIILDYIDSNGVSPECLIQLGMRLHVAKLNESVNDGIFDTYFVTLCTRRKTISDKRCGGSLTCALPWRIVIPRETTFEDAIAKMHELQQTIFRHQDYPFIEYRNLENSLFNYSQAAASSSMMFSWFPLEKDTMNGWSYEFSGYCLGRYVMPLYSYAMKDAKSGNLKFAYLYRTNLINEENIDNLQSNTLKALKIGCTNPKITIDEILNML